MASQFDEEPEFRLVLQADTEETYQKVREAINPFIHEHHVEVIKPVVLDLHVPLSKKIGESMYIDPDSLRKLIDAAPPEQRVELQKAVDLIIAVNNSLTDIADHKPVLKNIERATAEVRELRDSVADSVAASRKRMEKLGLK